MGALYRFSRGLQSNRLVDLVYLVSLVCFVYLVEPDQQTNQTNQINQQPLGLCLRTPSVFLRVRSSGYRAAPRLCGLHPAPQSVLVAPRRWRRRWDLPLRLDRWRWSPRPGEFAAPSSPIPFVHDRTGLSSWPSESIPTRCGMPWRGVMSSPSLFCRRSFLRRLPLRIVGEPFGLACAVQCEQHGGDSV